ncbi:MAG: hypothetical protein AB7G13_05590 [Lautropia sp.]
MKLTIWGGMLLALAALLSGCGDGANESSDKTAPLAGPGPAVTSPATPTDDRRR